MSLRPALAVIAVATCLTVVTARLFLQCRPKPCNKGCDGSEESQHIEVTLRERLPGNLQTWRDPGGEDDAPIHAIWGALEDVFKSHGLQLWVPGLFSTRLWPSPDDAEPTSNGFRYATSIQGFGKKQGQIGFMNRFDFTNGSLRPARRRDGLDVLVRVIAVGDQGKAHLNILKRIARGRLSLFSENHALPVLETIQFEDITFGIFPLSGFTLVESYGFWARNSAGDVVNMIMQALEGLAFIHKLGIAHRDAFLSNFVVEWQPESLAVGAPAISQPRVYLIDFECAVEFPPECPPEERRCIGYPFGGSLEGLPLEKYCRRVPPEVESGAPYDPFKLDVWQLGTSLSGFKTTILAIDDVLDTMTNPDAAVRPVASDILHQLALIVHSMPPNALLIQPEFPQWRE